MATLYITEYGSTINDIMQTPPLARQTVAISGSHAESAAFNASTRFIRLHTDAICSVDVRGTPTATVTHGRMSANQTEYLAVNGGDKVSVISNS